MKSMTKRKGVILAVAALAGGLAVAGTALMKESVSTVSAAETKNEGLDYFYNKLGDDENAKKFYETFEKLAENGTLKTGKLEYDLVANNVVLQSDVADYVNSGNTRIPKAYGAGRDAFYMDHPDLFYIDVFETSLSAGTKGKDYVAFLDSSRAASLYLGSLNTEAAIETAISAYESKLKKIVADAKAAGGIVEQISYVNKYICDNTEYSYGTVLEGDRNVDTPAAAYINTAYGSLVNGQAICGGYSKGFKAVMDRLDIPCVCIQGYSIHADGSYEAHMWNAVKVDGQWYNVDVTWNDTANASGNDGEQYLLKGSKNFDYAHQQDNVVSSSGYELDYPAIKPYDYGVDDDENGMFVEGEYTDSSDNTGRVLTLTVSYEGKGGEKLHEEGKYLAFRYGDKKDDEIVWDPMWFSAVEMNDVFAPIWRFEETQSKILIYANTRYIQFALMSRAPEESYGATYPESSPNAGKPFNYAYKTESLTESDYLVKPSAPYENDGHNSYIPAPWGNTNPTNTGDLPVNATYDIRITYTDSLEKIDPSKGVEMSFTSSRGDYNVREHAVVSDFNWDGDKVITFKFTPSKMYIHNLADYYFVPTNLQGVKSKKVPEPVRYCFKGKTVVCSKVFNDGRLYMNVFGEAQLLDTSDLSVTDFKDENGKYFAESQRSQLMLVVSKPDEKRETEMKDTLLNETPLEQKDIVSSATYEIDLQICGMVQQVPNGSYMQVAFGFPEGYSADDAGTTFKIYHYKHDDKGNITGVEEIPVIVTEYGLIARVHSFSPFTVVQVKNSSAAVTESKKAVYASALGNGSVTTADGKSGIATLEGDTVTYTLMANAGYKVAHVLLNGKAVEASKYANGKLTLNASELKAEGNTLEAIFVTQESADSYAAKGVEVATIEAPAVSAPEKPEPTPTPDDTDKQPEETKKGCGSEIGIASLIGALVVGAGIATVAIVLKKKNNG